MTTLRVTLDEFADSPYGGMSRYAAELTRALLATAPADAEVVGVVPASPEPDYDRIHALLPGLAGLDKSAFARRELATAWRRGLARPRRTGMLHATSLLAPLGAHDRINHPGDQVAVTIHDAIAWTAPELLHPRMVAWQRGMASRAERYADAIVVPSHAVADELAGHLDFGERIRVIPGAPSSGLIPPRSARARAAELGLPERYLFTVASTEPKKNLAALLEALPLTREELPLVVVGDDADAVEALARTAGLDEGRVLALGQLPDDDLGVAFLHAEVYLQPSAAEGFGLAVMEALGFGLPIIHTDVPALDELTAGAAISIPRDADGLPARLAEAIDAVDGTLAERLGTAAGDRARAFSWRDSAEKVWQLHADL
ncbi:MAG: glycosyltransferase family 1 protein [Leifsonia xyli]|nr:MAG: glycosyltransferase family 1 protein [Leifsonia xyli]